MLCFLVTLREEMFRTFSIAGDSLSAVTDALSSAGYSLAEVESIEIKTPEELGE